jgi:membrane-associated phospholipid phosphatase
MTPELRAALDDPETAEEVREYFHQPTLAWEPQWSRFGWADMGVMLGAGLVGLVFQFIPESETPRWTGGILVDEDVRERMVLQTYDERENVALTSDNLLALIAIYPFLIDGVVVSLLVHESPDVAAEMMLVDTLAYGITFAAVNITKKVAARERPFVQECAADPNYANGCNPNDHSGNSSFMSGHSAFSFTAAGLMCAHHINLELHGDPVADYTVCGAGLLTATTIAAMRIMADRHWFSDVLIGGAFGLLTGWLLPTVLRYQSWNPLPETEHVKMVPMPQVGPNQVGLGVTGIF